MWDAGGARTLRPRGAADRGATQAEAVAAEARMILEIFIATGGAGCAALVADPVRWTAESHSRWVKFEAKLK